MARAPRVPRMGKNATVGRDKLFGWIYFSEDVLEPVKGKLLYANVASTVKKNFEKTTDVLKIRNFAQIVGRLHGVHVEKFILQAYEWFKQHPDDDLEFKHLVDLNRLRNNGEGDIFKNMDVYDLMGAVLCDVEFSFDMEELLKEANVWFHCIECAQNVNNSSSGRIGMCIPRGYLFNSWRSRVGRGFGNLMAQMSGACGADSLCLYFGTQHPHTLQEISYDSDKITLASFFKERGIYGGGRREIGEDNAMWSNFNVHLREEEEYGIQILRALREDIMIGGGKFKKICIILGFDDGDCWWSGEDLVKFIRELREVLKKNVVFLAEGKYNADMLEEWMFGYWPDLLTANDIDRTVFDAMKKREELYKKLMEGNGEFEHGIQEPNHDSDRVKILADK